MYIGVLRLYGIIGDAVEQKMSDIKQVLATDKFFHYK